MLKVKDEEEILKTTREKYITTYKGIPIRLTANFSAETMEARIPLGNIFKVLKGKQLSTVTPISSKTIFLK